MGQENVQSPRRLVGPARQEKLRKRLPDKTRLEFEYDGPSQTWAALMTTGPGSAPITTKTKSLTLALNSLLKQYKGGKDDAGG